MGSRPPPSPGLTEAERARARKLIEALEPIATLPESDARASFVAGLAHYKTGQNERARHWFMKSLHVCRRQRGDRIYHLSTTQLVIAVGLLARKDRWDDLLEESARVYVDVNEGDVAGALFGQDEERNPALLWALALAEKGRWEELFHWAVRIGIDTLQYSKSLCELVRRRVPPESLEPRLLLLPMRNPTSENFRSLAAFLQVLYGNPRNGANVLKAARSALSEPRLELDCARLYLLAGDISDALEASQLGLALAEQSNDAPVEQSLALYAARLNLLQKDRAAAARILERLIARGHATRDGHVAEVLELAARPDQDPVQAKKLLHVARQLYDNERMRGFTPYLQLGRIHEALATLTEDSDRKRHAIEAVRYYNGHIHFGSSPPPWPSYEAIPLTLPIEGVSPSAVEGRRRMAELLGENYFIDKLVARQSAPLADSAQAQIHQALSVATDRGLATDVRRSALDNIKALGPAAAPGLLPFLTHEDSWVQYQIRQILNGWAEPIP